MSLAEYTIVSDVWTDIPEAQPRSRARIGKKGDANATALVIVNDNGTLEYAGDADIEIDTYQDPKYKDVREEVRNSAPPGQAKKVRPVPRPDTNSKGSIPVAKDG